MWRKSSVHLVLPGVLVGVFLGALIALPTLMLTGTQPQKLTSVPNLPALAQGASIKEAEAHFDFGHTRRLAVPCWPGYRCSEWDGLKLKDGRHSYAVIYIEPEARQSVSPPIRRPDNE